MTTAIEELPVASPLYRAVVGHRLAFLIVLRGARFQLHDVLRLRETDSSGNPTGAACYVQVTFIIADPAHGLRDGYAAIGFKVKVLSSEIDLKSLKK